MSHQQHDHIDDAGMERLTALVAANDPAKVPDLIIGRFVKPTTERQTKRYAVDMYLQDGYDGRSQLFDRVGDAKKWIEKQRRRPLGECTMYRLVEIS